MDGANISQTETIFAPPGCCNYLCCAVDSNNSELLLAGVMLGLEHGSVN